MTDYDSYFTNNDKPMAESLNDALLLSNMFDLNVDISLPLMYSNSNWSVSSGNRKAGVAITNVKDATGLSVSTVDEDSVITGSGTLKLGFYPNFNAFGGIDKISWTGTGTITCSIYKSDGTVIVSSVTNGEAISSTPQLKTLQNFEIRLTLTTATLKTLTIEMTNKEHTRYGAKIGINDVDDLSTELDTKANTTNNINTYEDIPSDSAWLTSGRYFKGMIRNGFAHITLNMKHNNAAALPVDVIIIAATNNLKFKPLVNNINFPVKLYSTGTGKEEIATIQVDYEDSYSAVVFRIYYANSSFGPETGVIGSFIYPIYDY